MMSRTGMDRREVLAAGAVIGAASLLAGEAAARPCPPLPTPQPWLPPMRPSPCH